MVPLQIHTIVFLVFNNWCFNHVLSTHEFVWGENMVKLSPNPQFLGSGCLPIWKGGSWAVGRPIKIFNRPFSAVAAISGRICFVINPESARTHHWLYQPWHHHSPGRLTSSLYMRSPHWGLTPSGTGNQPWHQFSMLQSLSRVTQIQQVFNNNKNRIFLVNWVIL